ncbi:metallophosphoesterase [Desulfovibrio sp. OttesenSCG-928-I05]|nr:metallophosphoesterase [Desulfovibrio sp. OttesenSCG-928-O18]MDL2271398.1 metallophosphoesterase [Desulfovibrio sp. OttesenSCG-928-I05]
MTESEQYDFIIYAFSDVHFCGHPPKGDFTDYSKDINKSIKKYIKNDKDKCTRKYVVIPGDLTRDNQDDDDTAYLSVWKNKDSNGFVVCEGFGNHDVYIEYDVSHAKYLGRYEFIANAQADYRRKALKDNEYIALSVNQSVDLADPQYKDAYYRWSHVVGGVRFHFIMLNLGMGDDDRNIKYYNAGRHFFYKSKRFLQNSLNAIGKHEPIIIFQHYGFEHSGGEYDWWPQRDQNSFLKVISGYNIIAMVYGHSHCFDAQSSGESDDVGYTKRRFFCVGSANSEYETEDPDKWAILKIKVAAAKDAQGGAIVTYEKISGAVGKEDSAESEFIEDPTEIFTPLYAHYVRHQTLKPGGSCVFDFDFDISDETYITGIKDFYLSFGSTDHHVKKLGVKLKSELIGERSVKISTSATLADDSGHKLVQAQSYITVVVVAYPKDKLKEAETETISAIQAFNFEFKGDDHHLKEYGVDFKDGKWSGYMSDNSGHKANKSVVGKSIQLPKALKLTLIQGKAPLSAPNTAVKEYAFLLNAFKIAQSNDDSHVCYTGIVSNVSSDGVSSIYFLEDDSKNHANASCFVSGYYIINSTP